MITKHELEELEKGFYKSGSSIEREAELSFEKAQAWAKQTLLNKPSTTSDEGSLYLYWLIHKGVFKYDKGKLYMNETWEKVITMLRSLETVGRARRELQEKAQDRLERDPQMTRQISSEEDFRIIGSNKARIRRSHLQEHFTRFFAQRKLGI